VAASTNLLQIWGRQGWISRYLWFRARKAVGDVQWCKVNRWSKERLRMITTEGRRKAKKGKLEN